MMMESDHKSMRLMHKVAMQVRVMAALQVGVISGVHSWPRKVVSDVVGLQGWHEVCMRLARGLHEVCTRLA